RDGVDAILLEPFRIARGVVTADDDIRPRHELLDALRQANRAIALGGEVALQADDVGIELHAIVQTALLTVDAHVDDEALMAMLLETRSHADRPQRLDEGEHLEPQNPSDRRLDERDFHLCLSELSVKVS